MKDWRTVAIVLLSVMVGILLAGAGVLPSAQAQMMGGRSGSIVCLVGEELNGYAPIILMDEPDQTILVYEYSYRDNEIELTSARTYRFDKLLTEFNIQGPSVGDVQRRVGATR